MKKNIPLRINEEERKDLDKVKDLLGEKTYSKTIKRLIKIFLAKQT